MTAIGIKDVYAYSFVCSRHFRKEDFLYEGRLSDKAIPSVFVSVYFSFQNAFYFTVLHKVISKDDEKFEKNELFFILDDTDVGAEAEIKTGDVISLHFFNFGKPLNHFYL